MKIGINGLSLMKDLNKDFCKTAQILKENGCNYIEPLSDWCADPKMLDFYASLSGERSNWDPENMVKRIEILKDYGIGIQGMFVFNDYLEEQAEELGQFCKDQGIIYVVITYNEYHGLDDIYAKVAQVKKVSPILKKYGVQMLIHNHEHDVAEITDKDGQVLPILDIFLRECSKEELMLEADTGWLLYAGIDPAEYVKKHLDRIMVLHFKDIHKDYKTIAREDIFLACGEGAVDFKAVLDAVPEERKKSMIYVLDQDASKGDIIEDQIKSMNHLRSLV